MDTTKLIALSLFFNTIIFSISTIAAQSSENSSFKRTEVNYQADNVTNQIPYFDNRFRIDAELDEITLLFYRVRGSQPIILVRPDGSKLRINNIDPEEVQWHDDSTFDIIKIKKPMPGPWQAIGKILPDSKILIVSEVKIAVAPLPEIVLEGETLKVSGRLFNGDDSIDTPSFRNVVKLDVHFYSTNNSIYDNFGADGIKVTSFHDDGRKLDEYAADGIFTGEFELNFAPGEWKPVYLVKLPMATRELRQKPIILHQTPISISVTTSESEDIPHSMLLTIDPTYVMPDSLVFQGKITFPDKQVEPFSIMDDQKGATRVKDIRYTEGGVHRINVSAFGKTTTGREFRLVVPEFSFNVKANDNQLMPTFDENGIAQVVAVDSAEKMVADKEEELRQAKVAQQQAADEKNTQTIMLIVAGNGVIIIIALILFVVMRKRKVKQ